MTEGASPWQEMIARCAQRGLLAKQLFVIFTTPKDQSPPAGDILEQHMSFQKSLEARGIMFGAGPLAELDGKSWGGEGMVIIRAESLEDARAIADADPMHSSGTRTYHIRPWLLNEGSLTLRVTYSDGGRELL